MRANELHTAIAGLLEQQVQLVLSTLQDNAPASHLMAYAFAPLLDRIYLASLADTRKVNNIINHPAVSLLWDNRTGNSQDHVDGVVLTAEGQGRCLQGDECSIAYQLLLSRNPELTGLMNNPQVVIMAISVEKYRWVVGYAQVMEYSVLKNNCTS